MTGWIGVLATCMPKPTRIVSRHIPVIRNSTEDEYGMKSVRVLDFGGNNLRSKRCKLYALDHCKNTNRKSHSANRMASSAVAHGYRKCRKSRSELVEFGPWLACRAISASAELVALRLEVDEDVVQHDAVSDEGGKRQSVEFVVERTSQGSSY